MAGSRRHPQRPCSTPGPTPLTPRPPVPAIVNTEIIELLTARGVAVDVDHAEGGWAAPCLPVARRPRRQCPARARTCLTPGRRRQPSENYKGQTALHCAAKAGFDQIVASATRPRGRGERQRRQGRNAAGDCVALHSQRQGSARGCHRPAHRRGWRSGPRWQLGGEFLLRRCKHILLVGYHGS